MSWIDWGILAAYACFMLGVGWFYSRRNRSAEDYFVGGRKMSPVLVGLSLFSTLVSTLSYLSWPGEIIANGPMFLAQLLAYPLVFVITGYAVIPLIMRQPVTSAYEILDRKLGAGIRRAGAASFLLLRLGWMATILFATSSLVLVPMLGVSPSWTPLLCILLGVLTVIYSSEGGIRAVVVTEAVQSLTMLAGAVITLAVVTGKMGGIDGWWPHQRPANWPAPNWGFDPEARISFGTVIFSTLIWYICTCGSDQMAIQRYLSTRDARAARKTLTISLFTDALVSSLLALTGIALLGFYLSTPSALPAGETMVSAGDRLFLQFILTEMPTGLAGIVIAAVLFAAMSSLSSGINSTCAVVNRDFLPVIASDSQSVSRMKRISWGIGIVAVTFSLISTFIQGNLIERCFKLVNLLTAPIFVLFFLALFVPFANAQGAWCGLIASIATAVAIAYSPEMGLNLGVSFMWMMPMSLLVGIVIGTIVSFVCEKAGFVKAPTAPPGTLQTDP